MTGFFSSPKRYAWQWGPHSLLFRGYRLRRKKLSAQVEILPTSGTSVAIPLLPLYTYMAWRDATLPT